MLENQRKISKFLNGKKILKRKERTILTLPKPAFFKKIVNGHSTHMASILYITARHDAKSLKLNYK